MKLDSSFFSLLFLESKSTFTCSSSFPSDDRVCLSGYARVYVCLSVLVSACLCVSVCVCLCACLCVSVCVCLCAYLSVHVFVYLSVFMCLCAYLSVSVCLSVCRSQCRVCNCRSGLDLTRNTRVHS